MNIFRTAKAAGPLFNLAKTAMQTALFWLTFLGVLPYVIVYIERTAGIPPLNVPGQTALGGGLFVLTGMLNLYSGFTMATLGRGTPLPLDMPRRLVVRGPYRYVRNPMAIGGLGAGLAVGVYLGSAGTLLYAFAGGVIWNRWVRPVEEQDLVERFGAPYVDYCASVRCWWPTRRYVTSSE